MQLKRVVVTGMGALTPIGNNVEEYRQALLEGVSGAAPITKFDTTLFKTKFACEVKGYDPLNFMDKKEARKMDTFCQYALTTTEEAVRDAQVDFEKINTNKVGVIWSSGIGGIWSFQDEIINYAETGKNPRFNPFFITKILADMSAGLISIKYGLRGVNFITVSACASSTNAIIDAYNYIRLGKANMIITGGSEASVTEASVGGFNAMKALSTRNEDPQTASRPFDQERDGFVLGEGSATLILEELEHARKRGAKIYAEVVGGGNAADAYHMTATHPEGLGAYLAMQDALEDAGLSPDAVDYINAHATSTPLGDVSEMHAIAKLFGESLSKISVSATKSMTGHLLGAAGAIEAVASILAIQHGMIPPTINTRQVDEAIPAKLDLTIGRAVEKEVNVAMSNTFGFGGHNAIAIFSKLRD